MKRSLVPLAAGACGPPIMLPFAAAEEASAEAFRLMRRSPVGVLQTRTLTVDVNVANADRGQERMLSA